MSRRRHVTLPSARTGENRYPASPDIADLGPEASLPYLRGYQAGYQDRVMGREPEHYAMTTRSGVRGNECDKGWKDCAPCRNGTPH